MKGPRLHISEEMRRFLTYPKFAGPGRMLILETQYFFDASWRRAAESLGWQTATVPSVMVGDLTRDQVERLFTTLGEFKPDFILTSNYAGMDIEGMFARFFDDARIPYISWFTDTPRMILYERTIPRSYYSVAATWEHAYTEHLRERGFEHVFYMPLATDPHLFRGAPSQRPERDLAFVGISMAELARQAWEKIAQLPDVTEAIRAALAEGRVTRERFAQGIEAILGPEVLRECAARDLRHAELCIVYEATHRARRDLARRLSPLGLEVRGDDGWFQILDKVGGSLRYYTDLAPFYRSTAVNLNTTSLQMKSAVNQRVFDCPAAGGFLITDAQGDLEQLFDPDSEMVTYSDLDELAEKVAYYLARPQERMAIVRRAQERIAAHHTFRHRLQSLEAYLRERFA